MTQTLATATPPSTSSQVFRYSKKAIKRIIPLAIIGYFLPRTLLIYAILGLIDVARNRPLTWGLLYRYYLGKGLLTWLLSPINILMDICCLPFINKGIYKLEDMPPGYQAEIKTLIDAAHNRNLVGLLEEKMGEKKRGMIFFQWYGKIIQTSVDVPEFSQRYKYLRTIGVSIFNKRQSTDRHFGPLRQTIRVLYNVNTIDDPNVYVQVGNVVHRWRDEKLFIFDDTLEHESHNESDGIRYCLFVDILRPTLIPWLLSAFVTCTRLLVAPVRRIFYKHWTIIK
jgi:beta-hydroxylase